MRLIARLLFLASIITALPTVGSAKDGGEVKFVRIWPQWRNAESFIRISEYFGGEENTGRQTMLRSQSSDRAGFYFLTRTHNHAAAYAHAKFVLEIITPDSPHPKTFEFSTTVPQGSHVYNLGLTGSDWPDQKTQPVAWRLRLISTNDVELASQHSFLWSDSDK